VERGSEVHVGGSRMVVSSTMRSCVSVRKVYWKGVGTLQLHEVVLTLPDYSVV